MQILIDDCLLKIVYKLLKISPVYLLKVTEIHQTSFKILEQLNLRISDVLKGHFVTEECVHTISSKCF